MRCSGCEVVLGGMLWLEGVGREAFLSLWEVLWIGESLSLLFRLGERAELEREGNTLSLGEKVREDACLLSRWMVPEPSPILGDQRSIMRTILASLLSICMETGSSLTSRDLSQGFAAISRISERMRSYVRLSHGEGGVGGGEGGGWVGVTKVFCLASLALTRSALAWAQTGQFLEPARWGCSQWIHMFIVFELWLGCLWFRGHLTLMLERISA